MCCKRFFTFFTFILFGSSLFASGVLTEVKGKVVGQVNEKVHLYRNADYVSMVREKVASCDVNADSTFAMYFLAEEGFEGILKIGNAISSIYIEPGGKYELRMPKLENAKRREENTIDIYILDLQKSDLNYKITDFNYRLDDLVGNYYHVMSQPIFREKLDSFERSIMEVYKEDTLTPFISYMHYSIAIYEQLSRYSDKDFIQRVKMFDKYVRNRPIEYSNKKYMEFLKGFFRKFLYSIPVESDYKFKLALSEGNVNGANEILKQLKFLKNEQLRELILIFIVLDDFYNKELNQEGLLSILNQISQKGFYEENRLIATNVFNRFTKLRKGYPAPDFSLLDQNDTLRTLEDYNGKHVYLTFYENWCNTCTREFLILRELHKKYGNDIVFISISLEREKEKMQEYLKQNSDFQWIFLHGGNNEELKNKFQIKSLPTYYLISPEGIILQSPAMRPSPDGVKRTIEGTFFRIHSQLHPKKKFRVGQKEN